MTECRDPRRLHERLMDEGSMSDAERSHAGSCTRCSDVIQRVRSFDAALVRSTRDLATTPLPTGMVTLARTMSSRRMAPGRLVRVAATAAALVVALAAGVIGSSLVKPQFDHAALRSDPAAHEAFRTCMAEAGFTPRPVVVGDQPDDPLLHPYKRAEMRCGVESGIADVDGDDPNEVAWANHVAVGMTECLRDQHWDLPDPELEPLGRYLEPPSGVVSDDPIVQADFNGDLIGCAKRFGIPADDE
ncbi:MAG: hypothetical protein H0U11_03660 [Chloroflexi bacterium]|nr:hypothetical protein [Chloroflexota bacterium]